MKPYTIQGTAFFRHYIVASLLSGRGLVFDNIRVDGERVGLIEHEVNFLRLVDKITNGTQIEINETGTRVRIKPGIVAGGYITHECVKQRGMGYYLEPLLMLAPFAKKPIEVTLEGVTNNQIDIGIDTIRTVTIPLVAKFGVSASLKIKRRGVEPLGGGQVILTCQTVRKLGTISLVERGKIKRIRGVGFTCRTSADLVNRSISTSKGLLLKLLPDIFIAADNFVGADAGKSPGYGLTLVAESTSDEFIGLSEELVCDQSAMQKHVNAEDIGLNAAKLLLDQIKKGGCVDTHHQSICLFLMSLAPEEVSQVRLSSLTPAGDNMIQICREFFSVSFTSSKDDTYSYSPTSVYSCIGSALINGTMYDVGTPTREELVHYCKWLGVGDYDHELRHILASGLRSKLPVGWKHCATRHGRSYYFDTSAGVSKWNHPNDENCKQQYLQKKELKRRSLSCVTNTERRPQPETPKGPSSGVFHREWSDIRCGSIDTPKVSLSDIKETRLCLETLLTFNMMMSPFDPSTRTKNLLGCCSSLKSPSSVKYIHKGTPQEVECSSSLPSCRKSRFHLNASHSLQSVQEPSISLCSRSHSPDVRIQVENNSPPAAMSVVKPREDRSPSLIRVGANFDLNQPVDSRRQLQLTNESDIKTVCLQQTEGCEMSSQQSSSRTSPSNVTSRSTSTTSKNLTVDVFSNCRSDRMVEEIQNQLSSQSDSSQSLSATVRCTSLGEECSCSPHPSGRCQSASSQYLAGQTSNRLSNRTSHSSVVGGCQELREESQSTECSPQSLKYQSDNRLREQHVQHSPRETSIPSTVGCDELSLSNSKQLNMNTLSQSKSESKYRETPSPHPIAECSSVQTPVTPLRMLSPEGVHSSLIVKEVNSRIQRATSNISKSHSELSSTTGSRLKELQPRRLVGGVSRETQTLPNTECCLCTSGILMSEVKSTRNTIEDSYFKRLARLVQKRRKHLRCIRQSTRHLRTVVDQNSEVLLRRIQFGVEPAVLLMNNQTSIAQLKVNVLKTELSLQHIDTYHKIKKIYAATTA